MSHLECDTSNELSQPQFSNAVAATLIRAGNRVSQLSNLDSQPPKGAVTELLGLSSLGDVPGWRIFGIRAPLLVRSCGRFAEFDSTCRLEFSADQSCVLIAKEDQPLRVLNVRTSETLAVSSSKAGAPVVC